MKTNAGSVMVAAGAFAIVTSLSSGAVAQQAPQRAQAQRPSAQPAQRPSAPQAQNGVQQAPEPPGVQPMPYPVTPTYTTPYGAPAPVGAERTEYVKPNMALLGAGGIAFLGAYVPGVVVALSSDHDGDDWLWFPVAGPWIDLASRGCGDNLITVECGTNGFDRAALITSGVVQALGVAAMFGGFALPSKRIVSGTASISLAPTSFDRHSHGLVAVGQF